MRTRESRWSRHSDRRTPEVKEWKGKRLIPMGQISRRQRGKTQVTIGLRGARKTANHIDGERKQKQFQTTKRMSELAEGRPVGKKKGVRNRVS